MILHGNLDVAAIYPLLPPTPKVGSTVRTEFSIFKSPLIEIARFHYRNWVARCVYRTQSNIYDEALLWK